MPLVDCHAPSLLTLSQNLLCQILNISEESWWIFLILCNCMFVWVWVYVFLYACVLVSGYHFKKEKSKITQQPFSYAWKYIYSKLRAKSVRALKFQSSLPPVSPCHIKSLQSQSPSTLASSWNPPYGYRLCCASSSLLGPLPSFPWEESFALPAAAR